MSDTKTPVATSTAPKETLRRSVSRKVGETFKGLGRKLSRPRSLSLPKISRAKGSKSGAKARQVKQKVAKKPAKRRAAPDLSPELNALLESKQEFVLWLGPEFAKSMVGSEEKLKGVELDKDVLLTVLGKPEMLEIIVDEEKISEAKTLLDGVEVEKVAEVIEMVKDIYKLAVGEVAFYKKLAVMLKSMEVEADKVDTLHATLIKALNPKLVVYSGADSMLQSQFKHDNFPIKAYTISDLQAKGFTVADLAKEGAKEQIMLKVHGDLSQPESLAFLKPELFAKYGLDLSGKPLDAAAITPEATYFRRFLSDLRTAYPIVYIGATFDRNDDPLSHLLAELTPEGGARDIALVTEVAEGDSKTLRFEGKDISVAYIRYSPDAGFTQIPEFMASMATVASTPFSSDSKVVTKAFVQSKAYDQFIVGMTEKEAAARVVCIFANDLMNVDFVTEESFKEALVLPEAFTKSGATDDEKKKVIAEALTKKEAGLSARLLSKEGESEVLVKLLLPLKSVEADITTKSDNRDAIVKKYETLLKTIEESAGKLDVRLVDDEEMEVGDFTLLYSGEKGVGSVALVKEEKTEFFGVSIYEENSNETEETVLLFERYWNVAIPKSGAIKLIQEKLTAPVEVESEEKKDRRRLFSGGLQLFGSKKKVEEKEKKEEKAEADPKKEVKASEKKEEAAAVVEEPKVEEKATESKEAAKVAAEEKKDEKKADKKEPKKKADKKGAAKKDSKKDKADKKVEKTDKKTDKKAAKTDKKADKSEKKVEAKADAKVEKAETKAEEVVAATDAKVEEVAKKADEKAEGAAAKAEAVVKEVEKKADKKADKKKATKKESKKETKQDVKKEAKKEPKKKAAAKKEKAADAKEEVKEEIKAVEVKVDVEEKVAAVEEAVKDVKAEEVKVEEKKDEKKDDKKAAKKKTAAKKADKKKADKAADKKKDAKKDAVETKVEDTKKEEEAKVVDALFEAEPEAEKAATDEKADAKVEAEIKAEEKAETEGEKEETKKGSRMAQFAARMRATLPRSRKAAAVTEEKKEEGKKEGEEKATAVEAK